MLPVAFVEKIDWRDIAGTVGGWLLFCGVVVLIMLLLAGYAPWFKRLNAEDPEQSFGLIFISTMLLAAGVQLLVRRIFPDK